MSRTLAIALIAPIALLVAGCSGEPASTDSGSSNSTSTVHEQAVQFAQCMRNNRVSQFPDPAPSGSFTIDQVANGSGLDTNSPTFTQALSACKSLEPSGFTGNTRTTQQQASAIQFARCIRANGVPDFPDPDPNGPLIDTTRIPSLAQDGGLNALHAAMQTCRSFATAAGVTGPG